MDDFAKKDWQKYNETRYCDTY